jgi:DNA-binding CsgD family transcriptional regulator
MKSRKPILTTYECRLLKLCSDGKTHQEIADKLHYSKKSIDYQLGTIYRKLGVDNKNDAIALARRRKLI